MRESKKVCYKKPKNNEYGDFCDDRFILSMYIDINQETKQHMKNVIVRENTNENKTQYWGYWDNSRNEFSFIYGSLVELQVCSPSFFKYEQEAGQGHVLNVIVEEVTE